MVNFTVWLIVGGIIGWLASIVMATKAQEDRLLNVVVGIDLHVVGVGRHPDQDRLSAQ